MSDSIIIVPYSVVNNPTLSNNIKTELNSKLPKCKLNYQDEAFKVINPYVQNFDINDIVNDEAYYLVKPESPLSNDAKEYLESNMTILDKTDRNNYYTEHVSKTKRL